MAYGLLKGKRGIIFGALNDMSIAWKVALKAHEEGARFTLTNTPVALRLGTLKELAEKTGSDLRMVGAVFYVIAAWDLCGIFGMSNFVLRPELAAKFEVPLSSTINAASGVLVLLVLGWGFTYFGQLRSGKAKVAEE